MIGERATDAHRPEYLPCTLGLAHAPCMRARPLQLLSSILIALALPLGVARAGDPAPPVEPIPMLATWEAAREAFWAGADDAVALLGEVATSPSAPAAMRRDALHLLGRRQLEQDQLADAIAAWRGALELSRGEAPSHLTDLIAFGLARTLVQSGVRDDEPLALLDLVDDSPHSPLHAEAAFLRARHLDTLGRVDDAKRAYKAVLDRWPEAVFAREVQVRLGALDVAHGKHDRARELLDSVAREAPLSPPAREAELLLASLGNAAPQRLDDPRAVPLAEIAFWVRERRFDLVGPALAPWLVEPPPGAPKDAVEDWLDALEIALDDHYENFRFDDALQTSEKLKKHKREGLSKARETRLHALNGDFDRARRLLKKRYRGKAYHQALGDLAYEFARYEEAYAAYEKVIGKKKKPTERMVWCLLRMGKADKAARHWERLGKTRGFNRNLFERYWYARALQLGDKSEAKAIFEALIEDAPLEYYGLQAWSRQMEIEGRVPESAPAPVLAVLRKNDEPLVGRSTVAWSAASLAGAFDDAARPAPLEEVAPVAAAFAERWGGIAEEAHRAHELLALGDVQAAVGELRVIDMDMRAMRFRGASLEKRARSDLLDNRSEPRARGGASMRDDDRSRKSAEQAAAMRRQHGEIRKDLRALQVLLADPYGTRRAVLEDQWRVTPELLAERGRGLYPIAYPEVVRPLTAQLGIPPYYVYAVMTVESAFHPGAVSVSSAYGLVQVIPRTGENLARELGFLDFTPERLLEPPVSLYFGGYYLARLLSRFHGQETLAAAAYNAGPHRVTTWLKARGQIPMDMFIEDIPYDQARGYTKTVLEHIAAYRRIYHGEEHVYIRNDIDTTLGEGPNY